MVKYVPHTCGKWACILTRSLEATKCGHEVSSPIKWIMRNSKIGSLIHEVPKHDPMEVQQSSQTFNNSWIKWSAKSRSQQGEKLWIWAKKLPLQVLDKWSPSDTKVSYKSWSMLCLKSALKKSSEQHQKETFEVITNSSHLAAKTWSWNFIQLKSNQLKWNKNHQPSRKVEVQHSSHQSREVTSIQSRIQTHERWQGKFKKISFVTL